MARGGPRSHDTAAGGRSAAFPSAVEPRCVFIGPWLLTKTALNERVGMQVQAGLRIHFHRLKLVGVLVCPRATWKQNGD